MKDEIVPFAMLLLLKWGAIRFVSLTINYVTQVKLHIRAFIFLTNIFKTFFCVFHTLTEELYEILKIVCAYLCLMFFLLLKYIAMCILT